MKKKKLELQYPIITSFPIEANILSIFFREEEIAWFLNYLIMLSNHEIYNRIDYDIARNGLLFYKNCPLINTYSLSRSYISKNNNSFVKFCISAIDDDCYLYFYVSKKDIPAYFSDNGNHDIMVYGYDEKEQIFFIADFFKGIYSYQTCRFEEMENAYLNAEIDYVDGVVLLKRNNWYQMKIDPYIVKQLLKDYLNGTNSLKLVNRILCLDQDSNYTYGLGIYHSLIKSIDSNEEVGIWDVKNVHILYDHKILLIHLVERLNQEGYLYNYSLIIDEMNKLKNDFLIIRNIVLKYNLISEKGIITERPRKSIQDKLSKVIEREKRILQLLIENIAENEIQLICNKMSLSMVNFLSLDKNFLPSKWENKYGLSGYYIVGSKPKHYMDIQFRIHGAIFYLHEDNSNDKRAVQLPYRDNKKIIASLYNYNQFEISLIMEVPMKVSLYFFDYERKGRKIEIIVLDNKSNKILFKQVYTEFNEGILISLLLYGNIKIRMKTLNKFDVVLSAIFFDKY